MNEQLFTVSFIDKDVHFLGPQDYDESRFRSLVDSLLEQCALTAYQDEIELALEREACLITWRNIEKHLPALLVNYGFTPITRIWTSVPSFRIEEDGGVPKLLGRAKELIDNYNTAVRTCKKEKK